MGEDGKYTGKIQGATKRHFAAFKVDVGEGNEPVPVTMTAEQLLLYGIEGMFVKIWVSPYADVYAKCIGAIIPWLYSFMGSYNFTNRVCRNADVCANIIGTIIPWLYAFMGSYKFTNWLCRNADVYAKYIGGIISWFYANCFPVALIHIYLF